MYVPETSDVAYQSPAIIYEGELEIQAGSPLFDMEFVDFEDLDF